MNLVGEVPPRNRVVPSAKPASDLWACNSPSAAMVAPPSATESISTSPKRSNSNDSEEHQSKRIKINQSTKRTSIVISNARISFLSSTTPCPPKLSILSTSDWKAQAAPPKRSWRPSDCRDAPALGLRELNETPAPLHFAAELPTHSQS